MVLPARVRLARGKRKLTSTLALVILTSTAAVSPAAVARGETGGGFAGDAVVAAASGKGRAPSRDDAFSSSPPVFGLPPAYQTPIPPVILPAVDIGPVNSGPPAADGPLGIPTLVLKAYRDAAAALAVQSPSCHLPWWLLAGIGHTESGHAESGRLFADGTTRGRILGPRLNGGIAGDAIITDTDGGVLDGDRVYDRAVGPMQFIPSTWARWGADGNRDGKSDPNNIFDATLAAGRYLCADGRDLATDAGLSAAVLSYNHSAPYLATVLTWGHGYRDRSVGVANSALAVVSDVTLVRNRAPLAIAGPVVSPRPAGSQQLSPSASSAASGPTAAGSTSQSTTASSTATSCPTPLVSATPAPSVTPTASSLVPTPTATLSTPVPNSSASTPIGCPTAASSTPAPAPAPAAVTLSSAGVLAPTLSVAGSLSPAPTPTLTPTP